jgi:hypothetical protein
MLNKSKYTGIALVLAWPQTYCKQARAWYDFPMRWLGFNVDYYYQAGHAAVILVEKSTAKFHYFDFGRYHSPYNYGRVRSFESDPELTIHTTPMLTGDDASVVLNSREILSEMQKNKSFHGDGTLYGSQIQIDFQKAYDMAMELQNKHFLVYGPFVRGGSNCSRFVSNVIQAGNPPLKNLIPLKYFVPLTPTTLTNVKAGEGKISVAKLNIVGEIVKVVRPDYRKFASSPDWLNETFPSPKRHSNVPESAQWLSGEGYGSWYDISMDGSTIELNEYGPGGEHESKALFSAHQNLLVDNHVTITYPSNCRVLTVIQNDRKIQMFPTKEVGSSKFESIERMVV